jgi:eukaryotic-like serine/threonine-protein kinase
LQVGEFQGGGLQGEVYAGLMDGDQVAVKWFRPQWINADPALRERLSETVRRNAPHPSFLWPRHIVTCADVVGFGYVMPFRERRFREFRDLVCGQIQTSFRALATAGLQTAEAYQRLHLMGLCYVDINPGNVAFDPDTGEVRIGDCDNVDVNGRGRRCAITGTEGFMAPEIVMDLACPTHWTDLWSLATLLFWAFMKNDPLLGRREHELMVRTREDELRLWGREALFIFDEDDKSNWPVEQYNVAVLRYWPIYPEFLRRLFAKAFTRGIREPRTGRVLETEWRTAMAQLRDLIMPCPRCGSENFCEDDAVDWLCWGCGGELSEPRRIVLPGFKVVAVEGAGLFAHHLDTRRTADSSEPILRVVGSITRPDILELLNDGDVPWLVSLTGGVNRTVAPGERIAMEPRMRIGLGQVEAEII